MNTPTALAVRDADPEPVATDPAAMRHTAAMKSGEAALLRFRATTLEKEARQLEHEAALWEKADAAEDAVNAIGATTPALEAAVQEAVAAEREAADHVRKAKARLSAAKAAEARADEKNDLESSEDAAARVAKATANVGKAHAALAAMQNVQAAAEEALECHRQEIRGADALFRAATASALNPGTAPGASTVTIEFGKPEGLSGPEKQYVSEYVLSHGILGLGRTTEPAPRPSQETSGAPGWQGRVARMAPGQARVVRQGTSTFIIPATPGR